MKQFLLLILIMTNMSLEMKGQSRIEIQGHRGARGLYPENTLPAFEAAQRMGVDVLELDLVITADQQVVVSHDQWLSATICMDTTGNIINRNEEKQWNIYHMTYEEVSKANCGIKPHAVFPQQKKMNAYKPLLSEVFEQTERLIANEGQKRVKYNIEIKSLPELEGEYHPSPAVFSDLVFEVIKKSGIDQTLISIQSFDFRVLQYWHRTYPQMQLVALVENRKSVQQNLENLGFRPDVYSPYFKLLNGEIVALLQKEGIRVIPWTVNDAEDMRQIASMGVDGIITDYPDRAIEAFR